MDREDVLEAREPATGFGRGREARERRERGERETERERERTGYEPFALRTHQNSGRGEGLASSTNTWGVLGYVIKDRGWSKTGG